MKFWSLSPPPPPPLGVDYRSPAMVSSGVVVRAGGDMRSCSGLVRPIGCLLSNPCTAALLHERMSHFSSVIPSSFVVLVVVRSCRI